MKYLVMLLSVLLFSSCSKMPDREFLQELQNDGLEKSELSLEGAVGQLVPPMPATSDIVFISDKDHKNFNRLITPPFSQVHYIDYDGDIESILTKIQDISSVVLVSTHNVGIEIAAALENVKGLMLINTKPNGNYLDDCETLLDKRIKTIYVVGDSASLTEGVDAEEHGMIMKVVPNSKENPQHSQPRIVEQFLNELI